MPPNPGESPVSRGFPGVPTTGPTHPDRMAAVTTYETLDWTATAAGLAILPPDRPEPPTPFYRPLGPGRARVVLPACNADAVRGVASERRPGGDGDLQ